MHCIFRQSGIWKDIIRVNDSDDFKNYFCQRSTIVLRVKIIIVQLKVRCEYVRKVLMNILY